MKSSAETAWFSASRLFGLRWLDKNLAEGYAAQEAELRKNNIRYEGAVYANSVHPFFNDATPERYNKVAAEQAWTRTIEWFNQYARA